MTSTAIAAAALPGAAPLTAQQLADQLNGIKYPVRIDRDLQAQAKAAGLVIVFGASDDLMEFRGAIHDEIGAYEGATAFVDEKGLLKHYDSIDKDDRDELKDFFAREAGAKPIVARWDQEGYSWIYQTDIPHATFEVLEDGEAQPYCRSIVFALADLAPTRTEEVDSGPSEDRIERIDTAIAEALGDAMDCTRVWSAWGCGTMSEDDFRRVADDAERVAEIRRAVLETMARGA